MLTLLFTSGQGTNTQKGSDKILELCRPTSARALLGRATRDCIISLTLSARHIRTRFMSVWWYESEVIYPECSGEICDYSGFSGCHRCFVVAVYLSHNVVRLAKGVGPSCWSFSETWQTHTHTYTHSISVNAPRHQKDSQCGCHLKVRTKVHVFITQFTFDPASFGFTWHYMKRTKDFFYDVHNVRSSSSHPGWLTIQQVVVFCLNAENLMNRFILLIHLATVISLWFYYGFTVGAALDIVTFYYLRQRLQAVLRKLQSNMFRLFTPCGTGWKYKCERIKYLHSTQVKNIDIILNKA